MLISVVTTADIPVIATKTREGGGNGFPPPNLLGFLLLFLFCFFPIDAVVDDSATVNILPSFKGPVGVARAHQKKLGVSISNRSSTNM